MRRRGGAGRVGLGLCGAATCGQRGGKLIDINGHGKIEGNTRRKGEPDRSGASMVK